MGKVALRIFEKYKYVALFAVGAMIFADVMISKTISDARLMSLMASWLIVQHFLIINQKVTIGGALIFLLLCPILMLLNKEVAAEKAAIWAYQFLAIGIVQIFIQDVKSERKDDASINK